MWFKQIQLFQLDKQTRFTADELLEKLTPFMFTTCLPSMQTSVGWSTPVDEDHAPLIRTLNGCIMLCLQVEEKILPAAVIRQELSEAIKQLEASGSRKIRQKEKYSLKDEITLTLLPRAFSKITKIYAYIDNNNHWLILGTASAKMTDFFMSTFKKSITDDIHPIDIKALSYTMTSWLKNQNYPSAFGVEKACVLQDPKQETRMIRCQQQDLFASSIQALLKDGCEAIQLALSWQDRVHFVLVNDFSLRSIQFHDEVKEQVKELEPETQQQQLDADFLIMTDVFSSLFKDLLTVLVSTLNKEKSLSTAEASQV